MSEEARVLRILVIDDNPADRQLVVHAVEETFPGADIIQAIDIAASGAAMEAVIPDLVVTDLDLRGSSGRDVLALVKRRHPACPVVMFTGTGDETIAVDLMKAGLDDYVVKSPRQMPRLKASLRLAVDLARSRAALTDREAQLTAMVAHRDTIVRELHHRVKNNLQTIDGLIHLSSRRADAATRAQLEEISGRIRALASVQARIYESEALDRVDVRAALADIAEGLATVYGHIELACDFDGPLALDVVRAMPLGLLCYELILNAMKHAWPGGASGILTVELRVQGERPTVRIRDDGIGFVDGTVTKGLGTRLVRQLAEQAGAEVEIVSHPGDGTTVTVRL